MKVVKMNISWAWFEFRSMHKRLHEVGEKSQKWYVSELCPFFFWFFLMSLRKVPLHEVWEWVRRELAWSLVWVLAWVWFCFEFVWKMKTMSLHENLECAVSPRFTTWFCLNLVFAYFSMSLELWFCISLGLHGSLAWEEDGLPSFCLCRSMMVFKWGAVSFVWWGCLVHSGLCMGFSLCMDVCLLCGQRFA